MVHPLDEPPVDLFEPAYGLGNTQPMHPADVTYNLRS